MDAGRRAGDWEAAAQVGMEVIHARYWRGLWRFLRIRRLPTWR
jgi:hypothetical protein